MRTLIIALFALLVVGCQVAPGVKDMSGITTMGTSTMYAMPDEAILTIEISNVDADVAKARAANESDSATFIRTIKEAGLKASDISTGSQNISIHFKNVEDPSTRARTSERDGYQAARSYVVTIKDLTMADKVYLAVCNSGINALPDLRLDISNTRALKDKARAMALIAAREKADAMAKVLGAKTGKARLIEEKVTGGYYGYANSNSGNSAEVAAESQPDTSETFPIGAQSVQASVTVTFELE